MNSTMATSKVVSRHVLRSTRTRPALRIQNRRFPNSKRFQSTTTPPTSSQASSSSALPGVIGGLVGGGLVFLGGYSYYHFSGAKTFVNTAHQTKTYFEKAFKKSTESVPEPNQAIQWLRETAGSYAAFIPGAKGYVDSAFDDLDAIHKKHGKEVDAIVKEAYHELKDASNSGMSIETVTKSWEILQKHLKRIGDLAGDAAEDILDNHPQLKEKVGGRLDQMKSMGDQYGPEAKKQVEDTWKQVQDIIKGGLGMGSIQKIQQLVQEKSEQIKKFGDEAWKKGMEQAGPILDKQPELKEMVEKNKDKLLQGNLSELWEKLKQAGKSGDVTEVKKFVEEQVKGAKDKAGSSGGGGLDSWFDMIPGGKEIMPKLQQLQELSEKHGKDAEKLIKDAIGDIKGVLEKKVDEGQKLAEKAKEDAKK